MEAMSTHENSFALTVVYLFTSCLHLLNTVFIFVFIYEFSFLIMNLIVSVISIIYLNNAFVPPPHNLKKTQKNKENINNICSSLSSLFFILNFLWLTLMITIFS